MRVKKLVKGLRLLGHPVYRRGMRHGVGAAIEHEGALHSLSIATVIDVGANKGQFSLLARALYPRARIHAFEPLEVPQVQFRRLFFGDNKVTLYPLALGENRGPATIHVSGRADSSSLLPITDKQAQLFPGTEMAGSASIAVERGDDILRGADLARPLLIKLDVQGYEIAALKGMPESLSTADFIYAEISFAELYAGQPLATDVILFLHEHGFRLAGLYNPTFDASGVAIQADALFARD